MTSTTRSAAGDQRQWLRSYYFLRAAFSFVWVAAVFAVGLASPAVAAILLTAYPAWDAVANYLDAASSGGLAGNRTQAVNIVVSVATTLAVIAALQVSMHGVLGVFGVWAILAGLLQLATALRRWKRQGAQWAMVLSGGQSALAGGFFIVQSGLPQAPSIAAIAGYAAVGAVYFLVSALWLTFKRSGPRRARPA